MVPRTYTILCDFRGGTYVSQVVADDVCGAVAEWVVYLADTRPIPRVSTYLAKTVAAQIKDGGPVPLNGLVRVWCLTAVCGKDLVIVNIVETAHESNGG